jgi:hypothetical protein
VQEVCDRVGDKQVSGQKFSGTLSRWGSIGLASRPNRQIFP